MFFFETAVLVGSCGVILNAPTLYDKRELYDIKLSQEAFSCTFEKH